MMMLGQTSSMGTSLLRSSGNITKLQDLCRMCASPCVTPVRLYGSEGVENELAVKFNCYLPVKVAESDTLPLHLCYECTNLLIQWDASLLVAIAADKKLRALQWREQQSQLSQQPNEGSIEENLEPSQQSNKQKTLASGESISCSICNHSGMEFRELVDHLKTHDMPSEAIGSKETSDMQNTPLQDKEGSNSEKHVDETLFRPVVCLETLNMERNLCSKTSGNKPEKSATFTKGENNSPLRKRMRGRRPKFGILSHKTSVVTTEGGSGDSIVTSSTSTPRQKCTENPESEDVSTLSSVACDRGSNLPLDTAEAARNDDKRKSTDANQGQNNGFKPKVRIISAESINQTLEERAKANQSGKNVDPSSTEVRSSIACAVLRPAAPSLLLKPSGPSQVKRLILSGGTLKTISSSPTVGPRFLKLADGRFIRLFESNSKFPTSGPYSYSTEAVQKPMIPTVFNKIIRSPTSPDLVFNKIIRSPTLPDPVINTIIQSPTSPDLDCQVLANSGSLSVDTDSLNFSNQMAPSPLKQSVVISNSRIITYNLQPGPRNSVNRYMCVFCGKKNLSQDSLQEHAQLHKP